MKPRNLTSEMEQVIKELKLYENFFGTSRDDFKNLEKNGRILSAAHAKNSSEENLNRIIKSLNDEKNAIKNLVSVPEIEKYKMTETLEMVHVLMLIDNGDKVDDNMYGAVDLFSKGILREKEQEKQKKLKEQEELKKLKEEENQKKIDGTLNSIFNTFNVPKEYQNLDDSSKLPYILGLLEGKKFKLDQEANTQEEKQILYDRYNTLINWYKAENKENKNRVIEEYLNKNSNLSIKEMSQIKEKKALTPIESTMKEAFDYFNIPEEYREMDDKSTKLIHVRDFFLKKRAESNTDIKDFNKYSDLLSKWYYTNDIEERNKIVTDFIQKNDKTSENIKINDKEENKTQSKELMVVEPAKIINVEEPKSNKPASKFASWVRSWKEYISKNINKKIDSITNFFDSFVESNVETSSKKR